MEFWVKEEGKGCATQVLEELGRIRLSLVQKKSGRKVEMVVEEMDVKQARLFSLLDMGKFIQD